MNLLEWATWWKIPPEALKELCSLALHTTSSDTGGLESRVQSEVRLAAAQQGKYLFRNNRGAGKMASGSFVRFGLANDTKALGDNFKSGDLIGWEPIRITQEHVGSIIARFLSVECKRTNWRPSNNLEEMAQVSWATLVNAQGGRAIITNNSESL